MRQDTSHIVHTVAVGSRVDQTACGQPLYAHSTIKTSSNPDKVDCSRCLAYLAKVKGGSNVK